MTERHTTTLDELTRRLQDFDQKERAREGRPVVIRRTPEQQLARQIEEQRKESERLGVGKARAARQKQSAQAIAYRQQAQAQALLEEAAAAYHDDEAWVEGDESNDWETTNPAFQNATSKLLSMGGAAEPYVQALVDEVGDFAVEEVAEKFTEIHRLAEIQRLQQSVEQQTAASRADGEKIAARIEQLIAANPQFQPQAPDLVAERDHYLAQSRAAELPDDKRYFIGKVKEIEVEQARRMTAASVAMATFSEWMANNPGSGFADAEAAFTDTLRLASAEYAAIRDADKLTRTFQATATEQGVGDDSRLDDGRLVMVSPDGATILHVTDDGVGPLLGQGFVPVRQFVAEPDADYDAALHPQPTDYEAAVAFAEKENARDHDAEALEAQQALGAEIERQQAAARAVEEERAKLDRDSILKDANQLAPEGD